MGHACPATTEHYRWWAERQMAEYGAYLPGALDGGKVGAKQRENGGKDGGKPALRVIAG